MDGFPQHYAAASLKPFRQARYRVGSRMFSAALRCGLIEAAHAGQGLPPGAGFPQHYAAASLKPHARRPQEYRRCVFRSITLRPH